MRLERAVLMATINILKNGTVVDDMSKVVVPKEVVKRLEEISRERRKNEKKEN
jgi:hypothetical protein